MVIAECLRRALASEGGDGESPLVPPLESARAPVTIVGLWDESEGESIRLYFGLGDGFTFWRRSSISGDESCSAWQVPVTCISSTSAIGRLANCSIQLLDPRQLLDLSLTDLRKFFYVSVVYVLIGFLFPTSVRLKQYLFTEL